MENKEKLPILPIIIAHFLLYIGIAGIGRHTKNKLEMVDGVIFSLFVLAYPLYILRSGCDPTGEICTSPTVWQFVPLIIVIFASWGYLIYRIVTITKKEKKS